VPAGEIGIEKESSDVPIAEMASESSDSAIPNPPDSPLRQRLRNALQKGAQPLA
jgi:hypothetical protein